MATHLLRSAALAPLLLLILALTLRAQSGALAPILVEPYDGKEVDADQIIWSWFMQSHAADGEEIFCDIDVVEILPGQTAEEAMRLNPPTIHQANLTTSSWQTPPTVRGLGNGKRYTWQITAKVRRPGSESFRIVSQSELWEFTYHDPTLPTSDSAVAVVAEAPPVDSMGVTVGDPAERIGGDTVSTEAGGEPKPIEISGSVRHTSVSENRRGTLSGTPPRFDRVQIDPTITLFGVPLQLSLLATTESNLRRSDISRGAFGSQNVRQGLNLAVQQRVAGEIEELRQGRDSATVDSLRAFAGEDSAVVAERIAQLERLQEREGEELPLGALEELNLLTPEQRTLARFPSFGFGQVAPSFGSLLFEKVTINGGLLEYNPGNLYIAGAAGKVGREVDPSTLPGASEDSALTEQLGDGGIDFFRNVYALRLGYGRRDESYIALTGLYAEDDEASLSLQSILNRPVARFTERLDSAGEVTGVDTVIEARRVIGNQRNYGFGGVGRLDRKELGLRLDGEFNLMYFDDDRDRPAQKLIPLPRALPNMLRTDSALVDFNFALRGDWELPESGLGRVNAGLRYVGGGYRSIGTAGLRADVLRADARYSNVLFERQVRVGTTASYEEAGYKDSSNTSRIGAVAANLDLRFRGLPVLSLFWSLHDQALETGKRDTAAHSRTHNSIELFNATLSWIQQWRGGLRWSLLASMAAQNGASEGDGPGFVSDSVGVFRTRTFQIDNRLALGPLVTLGALASWTSTRNHPVRQLIDSTGETVARTVIETSEATTIDLSTLLRPLDGLQFTVGGVVSYQNTIPQPAILGGYFSGRYDLGTFGSIELRFDYRESGVPALKSIFPVERVGRIITSLRW